MAEDVHSVSPSTGMETYTTVTTEDGTRLFLRTMPRRVSTTSEARAPFRAIFNDGLLCDGFIWKYLWNDVAELCDVAHWHYRGHGRSGASTDPDRVDIETHARDLLAVRRHLGDEPCILIGHSMGTQVLLEAHRLHPQNVRGLVLLCGSFGKLTQTFRGLPILDALLPKLTAIAESSPALVRAFWSRLSPEMALRMALLTRDVDPDNIRKEDFLPYIRHVRDVDFPFFLRMLRAAGDYSAEEHLPNIDVPVLIIAAERDTFTPPRLSRFMAERIPNAELVMVPNGSHAVPIEQPDFVGARVREFITRVYDRK
ncbi:MAG TPA: alpha/beta hydrolase [Labilithrix sp.]|nr:alpha/beta hydrolase [Labilithrix sp.]